MPIKFKCSGCSAVLQVKDELAGKKGRCPKCQSVIVVPTPSAEGAGAPAPQPSAPAPAPRQPANLATAEPPKQSKLMYQHVGPVTVATITEPRITEMSDIREVGDELMALLEKSEKPQIVIDFSKVTYLPSAMIGKLTAMHKKAKSYKGALKMCAITPGVMQIFKITRLDKVFDILPDMNTALNSFKGGFLGR